MGDVMCYLQSAFSCCRIARHLCGRWKLKDLSEVDGDFQACMSLIAALCFRAFNLKEGLTS